MNRIVLALCVLLLSVSATLAGGWQTERFQTVHARIALQDSVLGDEQVTAFDSVLEAERSAHGILLDLRLLKYSNEASARVRKIIARFAEQPIALENDTLRPRGEWQYGNPVVILADSSWLANAALAGFIKHRRYSEFVAGDLDKAERELRGLVRRKELLRQDRMQEMFRK